MERRESGEVLLEIKRDYPRFDKESFIEGAKTDIRNLYYALCNDETDMKKINVTKELKDRIMSDKEAYRINKDFDTITIQYIDLCNYVVEKNKNIIKVYASMTFYDDIDNNEIQKVDDSDKFFNDAWIVSYENCDENIDLKCDNCGATMEKDEENNLLKCNYCRTSEYYNFKISNWKIRNIEVFK